MCKRFFVEVKGLDDNGKERLIAVGVKEDAILVVDEQRHNQCIYDAIQKACGVTPKEICSKDSRRTQVIARTIYVYYALELGDTVQMVSQEIAKDRTSMKWYVERFHDSLKYDKSFESVFSSVQRFLNEDPNWSILKARKPIVEQKKSKKRRKTRNKSK